jgi:adenylate cyclase
MVGPSGDAGGSTAGAEQMPFEPAPVYAGAGNQSTAWTRRLAMRVKPKPLAILVLLLITLAAMFLVALAGMHSFAAGAAALIVITAGLTFIGHNHWLLAAKLRDDDDRYMFQLCSSGLMGGFRRIYRHLPADPRCRVCLVPFGGLGRLLRISPSRKNPNFCTSCIDSSPEGGHDMEVGVLFADIRGFTAWSSSQPASMVGERVTRFYDLASRALMQDDALIEFVGDQVMALYLPSFPSLRERISDAMLAAAERLVGEVGLDEDEDPLRIGVGMNRGIASIGNVRKGGQKDFTAVGDVVNTASRLQGAAGPGEIVIAESVFETLTMPPASAEQRILEVKGKSEVLPVRVLQPP